MHAIYRSCTPCQVGPKRPGHLPRFLADATTYRLRLGTLIKEVLRCQITLADTLVLPKLTVMSPVGPPTGSSPAPISNEMPAEPPQVRWWYIRKRRVGRRKGGGRPVSGPFATLAGAFGSGMIASGDGEN